MSKIQRILISTAAIIVMLAVNVFALSPDSELTVTQLFPTTPESVDGIPEDVVEPTEPAVTALEAAQAEAEAPAASAAPESAAAQPDETVPQPEETAAETSPPVSQEPAPIGGGASAATQAPAQTGAPQAAVSVAEILIVGGNSLAVGESLPLSAVALPEEAANRQVAWSSSDSRIAAVSGDGVVTALSAGQAEITATALDGGGARASIRISTYIPQAEAVTNVPVSLRIGVGQSVPIHWVVLPAQASQQVDFKTSNQKIATVTADGKVRGVKAGTCTVTVQTPNGKTQSCRVEVAAAPKALSLNATELALGIDAEANLRESFVLRPRIADNAATSFSFRSNRESVVTVSDSGLIMAQGLGEATVTVTTHNNLQASCRVLVRPAPRAVSVSGQLSLSVGDALPVSVVLEPEDAAGRLSYSSSNTNVMTVSADGRIHGAAVGAATLTVQSFNGKKSMRRVNVYPAPERLTAPASITVGVGEQRALEAWIEPITARSALSYASSQKKIATVDAEGTLTGVRAGTATVTISTYNGKKATVKVTVKKAPGGVTLNASELTLGWDARLKKGETARLTAVVNSGSAGSCEFSSSDPWVARVDPATGEVCACAPGTAVITATAYNGASASCTVRVEAAPTALRAAQDSVSLGVGQSWAFAPACVGGASRLTYISSNEGVAAVSETGTIVGRAQGTATVTAETFNGLQASVSVTVLRVPGKITLAQSSATIGVGATYQILPVLPEDTMAGFSYSSSKKSVATVNADGLVTGMGTGTAIITVKTHNGKQATFTVTVVKAPTSLTLSRTELTMQPTELQVIRVTLNKGAAANITFASSDESVAIVDGAGNIEALRLGECVVVVTTNNGLTAECAIHVVPGPAAIRVPADMRIGTSELVWPGIEILDAEGRAYADEYTLTSSNSGVVTVSGTTLTGKKAGTATITVRSHTITATFGVEVIKYATLHTTRVFAHRGASAYAEHNTIEAFRLAYELGADGVELDVRRTLDGALVVFHDASIEVNGRKRLLAEMTLAELQAIDLNGSRVPTLDEALDYILTTEMSVQVELKEEGIGGDCAEAVRSRGLGERALFVSFSLKALTEVKYEDPAARLGYLFSLLPSNLAQLAQQYELYAILPRQAIVNESLVNRAHAAGLKIGTWTINDAESVAQLSQMGVDYIATDFPDMAVNSR